MASPYEPYAEVQKFAADMRAVVAQATAGVPKPVLGPSVVEHQDGSVWTTEGKMVRPARPEVK